MKRRAPNAIYSAWPPYHVHVHAIVAGQNLKRHLHTHRHMTP